MWKVQQQHQLHNLSQASLLGAVNGELNVQVSQIFQLINRTGDLNEENIIKISKWVQQTTDFLNKGVLHRFKHHYSNAGV